MSVCHTLKNCDFISFSHSSAQNPAINIQPWLWDIEPRAAYALRQKFVLMWMSLDTEAQWPVTSRGGWSDGHSQQPSPKCYKSLFWHKSELDPEDERTLGCSHQGPLPLIGSSKQQSQCPGQQALINLQPLQTFSHKVCLMHKLEPWQWGSVKREVPWLGPLGPAPRLTKKQRSQGSLQSQAVSPALPLF